MKYFVDEEDFGNLGTPLIGVNKNTVWFNTKEEAQAECDRYEKESGDEIVFLVWDENSNPVKWGDHDSCN